MALDQSTLASALASVFGNVNNAAAQAADGMAQAYFNYASGGTFGSGKAAPLPVSQTALAGTLLGAIADPLTGSPAKFAGAWASGVATFWLGAPVTGGQSGSTISCTGAASLTGSIAAAVASPSGDASTAAGAIAAALHAATITTTALVYPPPSGATLTIA